MQSKFDLSSRRAPHSRSFSLFSAVESHSPTDMPARPPSPRASSPGGRPPRTCTPLTAGRRRAARRHSVNPRGRPAPPRPAEGTRERAPHGRPRRARFRPAGDPCGPACQRLADSPRASHGKMTAAAAGPGSRWRRWRGRRGRRGRRRGRDGGERGAARPSFRWPRGGQLDAMTLRVRYLLCLKVS